MDELVPSDVVDIEGGRRECQRVFSKREREGEGESAFVSFSYLCNVHIIHHIRFDTISTSFYLGYQLWHLVSVG